MAYKLVELVKPCVQLREHVQTDQKLINVLKNRERGRAGVWHSEVRPQIRCSAPELDTAVLARNFPDSLFFGAES